MKLIVTDIDKLLETTSDLKDEDFQETFNIIEIDKLLELTQNW
ncbi:hypothetical protein [Bacillus massilinigeriensis]|nr:hypothetical protein [Bacillus massilionigeriensis]